MYDDEVHFAYEIAHAFGDRGPSYICYLLLRYGLERPVIIRI